MDRTGSSGIRQPRLGHLSTEKTPCEAAVRGTYGRGMADTPGADGYAGDDFYCDVAIPDVSALDVVFDDEHVLAFHHTRPFWQTHIVVVPKKHIASLTTVTRENAQLMEQLFAVVQSIARDLEESTGAAAVLTNLGRYQDSKHLHVHVHSGHLRSA